MSGNITALAELIDEHRAAKLGSDAFMAYTGRHWNQWISTRLRDHANGLHADKPSTICPDCQRSAELEAAS